MAQKLFLGIDIGTYETKGVLVDNAGNIISQAAKKHEMIVPQSGWAEHRPMEDWWGDFTYVSKKLIEQSKCNSKDIAAVSASTIGPCMLPLDKNGDPLMNAVLYGVDTRAHKEIDLFNSSISASSTSNSFLVSLTSNHSCMGITPKSIKENKEATMILR